MNCFPRDAPGLILLVLLFMFNSKRLSNLQFVLKCRRYRSKDEIDSGDASSPRVSSQNINFEWTILCQKSQLVPPLFHFPLSSDVGSHIASFIFIRIQWAIGQILTNEWHRVTNFIAKTFWCRSNIYLLISWRWAIPIITKSLHIYHAIFVMPVINLMLPNFNL